MQVPLETVNLKMKGEKNSTNLGGNRCWIETQIWIEKDLNLGGGSVHPHLPPTELSGNWYIKQTFHHLIAISIILLLTIQFNMFLQDVIG